MNNLTAKVSCFARAYHTEHTSAPIFSDPAARPLLGPDYGRIAASMLKGAAYFLPGFDGPADAALRLIVDKQLSPSVLARSAFCESALDAELRLGCRQIAVLAAGYDTLAIRRADAGLSIYELDLPDLLQDKRAKIKAAGLQSCAVDVPCDLSDPAWPQNLLAAGFTKNARTFVTLLGITYYLDKPDLRRLLTALCDLAAPGSALCLDYPTDDEGRAAQTNRALAAAANENMKARYRPGEMEQLLDACGFLTCEHLNDESMTERFFADYNAKNPEHPMCAPEGVGYVLGVRREMNWELGIGN